MAEDKEAIIKNVLVAAVTQLDALRGLVLAMLDASTEKNSILVAFSAQSHKLSDLLLDSPLSDAFLAAHQKAQAELLKIAGQSRKPL